jgi:hypothetical protein
VQGEGHGFSIPSIPGEPEKDRAALSPNAHSGHAHAREVDAVGLVTSTRSTTDGGSSGRPNSASWVGKMSQVWAKCISVTMVT